MEIEDAEEHMLLSMGPQHPSTHGVLRLLVELDGETVVNLAPDIGFLHTGIEKNMEAKTYTKALVMTDRMDYLSPHDQQHGLHHGRRESCSASNRPPRPDYSRDPDRDLAHGQSPGLAGNQRSDLAAMSVFLYASASANTF
jgi:NADH-quinone oxidoreductase subunit D